MFCSITEGSVAQTYRLKMFILLAQKDSSQFHEIFYFYFFHRKISIKRKKIIDLLP